MKHKNLILKVISLLFFASLITACSNEEESDQSSVQQSAKSNVTAVQKPVDKQDQEFRKAEQAIVSVVNEQKDNQPVESTEPPAADDEISASNELEED